MCGPNIDKLLLSKVVLKWQNTSHAEIEGDNIYNDNCG